MKEHAPIVILGATGAVGREVLHILAARGVPASRIRALASERSAGNSLPFGEGSITVREVTDQEFKGASVAIFAGSADLSRRWTPIALEQGATVIDNSSAFRLDPSVPLIVPEINADVLTQTNGRSHDTPRLIANPNCSTIILLVALEPIRRTFGIRRIDVATYQAVSGAGLEAIEELQSQARAALVGAGPLTPPRVFKEPCAFNVFSHDSAINLSDGTNGEERKIIEESRKIWNDPTLRITPTCVRVPVVRAHTMAVTVELAQPTTEHDLRAALAHPLGISVVDDRANNAFPTPLKASGQDRILVGRLRPDPCEPADSQGRHARFCLLLAGDQLRKGAATNAVQIADILGLSEPTSHTTAKIKTPAFAGAMTPMGFEPMSLP